jgi:hypothetical protein
VWDIARREDVAGLKAWLRQRAQLFVHKGARLVGAELADPVYDQVSTGDEQVVEGS